MSDISNEMIKQAVAGDITAFESIYQAYFSFVSNVAWRMVSNRQDAEDVTQEVFVTMYHQLKNFRFDSSLKTWAYRITVNTSINYLKKRARHQHQAINTLDMADASDPKHILYKEFNQRIIDSLLNSLNPDQRACIILRTVENLSYQEIADTLQIPVNTVRTRIKRAREVMMALRSEVINNEL